MDKTGSSSSDIDEASVSPPLPKHIIDALKDRLDAGDLSLNEFLLELRAAAKAEDLASGNPIRIARAAMRTPAPRPGKQVAIRSLKNDFDVRILSQKQLANGFGVEALIGTRGNPRDFEIGYVDEGAKSFSLKARDSFTSVAEEKKVSTVVHVAGERERFPTRRAREDRSALFVSALVGIVVTVAASLFLSNHVQENGLTVRRRAWVLEALKNAFGEGGTIFLLSIIAGTLIGGFLYGRLRQNQSK